MIVCHCNVIARRMIEDAVREMLGRDPGIPLAPQVIYAELGKRGKCCGCFPEVEKVVDAVLASAAVEPYTVAWNNSKLADQCAATQTSSNGLTTPSFSSSAPSTSTGCTTA